MEFQSTRPLRGATFDGDALHVWMCISIHAPLAGRDACRSIRSASSSISIHAPLAGRDSYQHQRGADQWNFNPRAPCGARLCVSHKPLYLCDISIHAPLAGRDLTNAVAFRRYKISIHAPLAGRDGSRPRTAMALTGFQSTRPLRGATSSGPAPRRRAPDFNPRAPCGARRSTTPPRLPGTDFNPRAPCGARHNSPGRACFPRYFNPRAPCGARQL